MLTAILISTLGYAAYEILSYLAARNDEQNNDEYNAETARLARKCGTTIVRR